MCAHAHTPQSSHLLLEVTDRPWGHIPFRVRVSGVQVGNMDKITCHMIYLVLTNYHVNILKKSV